MCRRLLIILLLTFMAQPVTAAIEVRLPGLDEELTRNIQAYLSLYQQRDEAQLTSGRIHWLHGKAEEEIRQALRPLAYYEPQIESQLQREGDKWIATYKVTPGTPINIVTQSLKINGEAVSDLKMLAVLEELPLQKGDAARHDRYEASKKLILRRANERGYFDAKLTEHQLQVDLAADSAHLILHLDSGPRYRFGPVRFSETVLAPDFLRRYVGFAEGEPYEARALLDLQAVLSDTDFFETVIVRPRRKQAQDLHIPIDVELRAKRRTKYTVGLGYGTDTGPRASAGMERRYVNTRGHSLAVDLATSELINRAALRYVIPLAKPSTDRLIGSLEWQEQDPKTSDSESFTLGVTREQEVGDWRRVQAVSYLHERFRIGSETGTTQLLMPAIGFRTVRADDPVDVHKGYRLNLELRGAAEGLLADTSFVQLRGQAKWVRGLGPGRVLLRGEVGATWVEDFSVLPPSVRFFAGGDFSVRGFDYQTLGPRDSQGRVVGGKHLLLGSVEYDFPIKGAWRGAVFYDVGNAINDFNDSLVDSAGIGLRYKSPVGWLRVDLAHPIDAGGYRFHLTFGPDL